MDPVNTPRTNAPRPASGAGNRAIGIEIVRNVPLSTEAHQGTGHGPGAGRDTSHKGPADRAHQKGPALTLRQRIKTIGLASNSQPPLKKWGYQMMDQVLNQNRRDLLLLLLLMQRKLRELIITSEHIKSGKLEGIMKGSLHLYIAK